MTLNDLKTLLPTLTELELYQLRLAVGTEIHRRDYERGRVIAPFIDLTDEEKQLLQQGYKIQALKSIRTRTGMGLYEAKEATEAWEASQR